LAEITEFCSASDPSNRHGEGSPTLGVHDGGDRRLEGAGGGRYPVEQVCK